MKPITKYHPVIGYTFIENVSVSVPHERGCCIVHTNSAGIRSDREFQFRKDPKTFRILLFGDSFTAADSVANSERYSDLLEKKLTRVEILNFGLPGSGTDQQFLMFREKGLKYDFDMVMVAPLLENIRRNVADFRLAVDRVTGEQVLVPKPVFDLIGGELKLRNVPVPESRPRVKSATRAMLEKTDFGGAAGTYGIRDFVNRCAPFIKPVLLKLKGMISKTHADYLDDDSSSWLLMRSILEEFKRPAKDKAVVICPLPYYVQIEDYEDSQAYLRRFQSLDDGASIRVLDVFQHFRTLSREEKRKCRWKRDIHYTPFAHRVLADALCEELRKSDVIPKRHFKPS